MEKTFMMIKPDGVKRGLIGEIVKRLEVKGFTFSALKLSLISKEIAQKHYEEHLGKPFYKDLIEYITSGPVLLMVIQGHNAVLEARKMIGATNPNDAMPGTIRGDYAWEMSQNVVHGADSAQSALREINLYFERHELI
ncbi:nucleoside diphosphate kinase [Desulfonispora thiosulfatigenes DSM 11270]|uniref:Nucleoside diphosphate kinase n=1 Tax=Desulfonispora thiosulfatigenes DSM 11270 TaxID=656914 RepID=A0A1W1UYK0_DESTI|nr:nucleoside-diphosphate kinase [Desulfonispora thiosulfatigenes]SMB86195.1 nucleoside diphosphate kinase [Desulfonispora thiosulfatigenes DSM 11270]